MQIQSSVAPLFHFPEKVRSARHILIKPNMGYPAKPPVVGRMALLGQVIEQLLALQADSHITLVEGVCSKIAAQQVFEVTGLNQLAQARVTVVDAEQLPQCPHSNTAAKPFRFSSMVAPSLLNSEK